MLLRLRKYNFKLLSKAFEITSISLSYSSSFGYKTNNPSFPGKPKLHFQPKTTTERKIKLDLLPKLSAKPRALPDISRIVKLYRKELERMPFNKREEHFKSNPNYSQYFIDLVKDLQSDKLELYGYPMDLINLLIDIHKINDKWIDQQAINNIIENQILKINNPSPDLLPIIISFFAKFEKHPKLWSKIVVWFDKADISYLAVSEIVNIMWGLNKVDELNNSLYQKLSSLLYEREDKLNFIDIAVLSNIYHKKKEWGDLVKLSETFLRYEPNYKFEKLNHRDISEFFWNLSFVSKSIDKRVIPLVIRNYVIPQAPRFTHSQDIAQILITSNKLKDYLKTLPADLRLKYETTLKELAKSFLSKYEYFSSQRNEKQINEQDLCNVLFSLINFEFIEENFLRLLLNFFFFNIGIIKPIGIGYCLHALSMKRKTLFLEYAPKINECLEKHPELINHQNIGYMIWIMKELGQQKSTVVLDRLLAKITSINPKEIQAVFNIEQYFHTFHALETMGMLKTKPEIFEKLFQAFLSLNEKQITEARLISFSIFFQSLMVHYDYKLPSREYQNKGLKQILSEITLSIIKFLKQNKDDLKGFGSLVYNIMKSEINDTEVWNQIKDLISSLTYDSFDLAESIHFMLGIQGYWGPKSEIFEIVRYKFFKEKIRGMKVTEIRDLVKDEPYGKTIISFFSDDIKGLLKSREKEFGLNQKALEEIRKALM